MDNATNVIGTFSEEHAAQLGGVSMRQLRRWNRNGLLRPAYGANDSRTPYGRVYSFRDLVSLRVLGQLRNEHRVPEKHLIEVQRELSRLSDEPWAAKTLEVLGRRVVVKDESGGQKREVVGGQRVFDIPLRVVIGNLKGAVAKLNERGADKIGKIERHRFISENQPVIAGTRIPVDAIRSFAAAGYDVASIVKEYPSLTKADVEAALAFDGRAAAA